MKTVTFKEFLGEFLGTFILVFFGLGSVAVEVVTDISLGLPIISLIWGIAVAIAIHFCSPLSGAHINSAMTLAFATWTEFSWRKAPGYLAAQFAGAMTGALVIYGLFFRAIRKFEAAHDFVRGEPGSEESAKIFGEFYHTTLLKAFIWEASGTFLLAAGVFWLIAFTNRHQLKSLLPILIGLWLAFLIWLVAPVTQAGFNPARDLGPRIISSLLGWGTWSFKANGTGWLLVYVIAPCLGALIGGRVKFSLFTIPLFGIIWAVTIRAASTSCTVKIKSLKADSVIDQAICDPHKQLANIGIPNDQAFVISEWQIK